MVLAGCGSATPAGPTGTLDGYVQFATQNGTGVVRVLTSSGQQVAQQNVSRAHNHFRFRLEPGRYGAKIDVTRGLIIEPNRSFPGCTEGFATVRAKRTAHVWIGGLCGATF